MRRQSRAVARDYHERYRVTRFAALRSGQVIEKSRSVVLTSRDRGLRVGRTAASMRLRSLTQPALVQVTNQAFLSPP